MKTGTEALSARLLSEPLPDSLFVPAGELWPQPRTDVVKHPELELLGTRRGAPIERRLESIVAAARSRDVPDVTVLLIAEALNVAKYPDYIVSKLASLADSLVIVFFARHQAAALHSVVAHRVQSWTSPKYTTLDHAVVMKEAKKRFHYDQFVDRWSGPSHTLIPLPYFENDRRTDALMERFTKFTKIVVPAPVSSEAKNASLGKDQLIQLGELKTKRAWMRRVPLLRDFARIEFFRARKRLQREKQGTRWAPTAAEKREIVSFYTDSNANFKKLLGGAARRDDWKSWFASLSPTRTR